MPNKLQPTVDLMAFKCRTLKVKASALLLYVLHDCEKWVKIRRILLLCTTIKYTIQMYVTDTEDIEFKPYFDLIPPNLATEITMIQYVLLL
jgi:hypothetical protein